MAQLVNYLNDLDWLNSLAGLTSILFTCFGSIFFIRRKIVKFFISRQQANRNNMIKEMSSPEYIIWEQRVLSKIYDGLEFVSLYEKTHSAVIIRPGKNFAYPFSELCNLTSTRIDYLEFNPLQKDYLLFLGSTVKRPKMKGFATKEIVLEDGKVVAINARTTNYEQNLVTAHILEWELFKRYDRKKQINDDILSELTLRSAYHGDQLPQAAILKPANAYPLISVQALVIYKDYKDPDNVLWKAIVAQRQKDVAIKPGLWQIHPAGGFEVYGNEDDDLTLQLRQGFDVRTALFREYAEEIYGIDEFSFRGDGRDSGSILSEQHISHLIRLIHAGNASMDFLGIVTDLTVLRHELSFLIVIDDPEYSQYQIRGSSEAKCIFSLGMADLKATFSTHPVHSSSAGLLQLAIETDRLKMLGISEELEGEDLGALTRRG